MSNIVIIGSGPAGLTIAVILARYGYDVTIFESHDKIGGVLRYGIPDFRLPKSILDRYQQRLLELGVRIRPNTTIGGALRMDDLFRDGYSAVFIGTGVWRPNSLGIKGESLGNVHFAIDYLCNPAVYNPGEVVSVIGAGNAAIDAARTILRHGARKVTVFARSGKMRRLRPQTYLLVEENGNLFINTGHRIDISYNEAADVLTFSPNGDYVRKEERP